MMWSSFSREINKWRISKLRLPYIYGLGSSSINLVTASKLPFSAMWSAAFVPKPEDWPKQCEVVGTFFVEQKSNFDPKPFEDLMMWLRNGPKPVFIGFGSMVIKDPQALEQIIKDAARAANVRVLVQSGWSKLDVEDESGLCHNVGPCPHDWLLPMCCAVIHHGGAGTTAAGLRLGLPTFVCPFFGDQFMWGWFVSIAGVGPKACPITKLTEKVLAKRLMELSSEDIQGRAQALAQDMANEDGIVGGRNHFVQRLVVDNMLCDVSLLLGETKMARHRLIGSGLRQHGIKVSSEVAGKDCWHEVESFPCCARKAVTC
jgi:UDP:flavonoid glycosyltransferase YjiC (YdhE family)